MAYRELIDEQGDTWVIWDTYPGSAHRVAPATLQDGWLTFRSGDRLRRLVPAPTGWEEESEERLRGLLQAAAPVTTSAEIDDPREAPPPGGA